MTKTQAWRVKKPGLYSQLCCGLVTGFGAQLLLSLTSVFFYFKTRKTIIYSPQRTYQDSCTPFSVKISRYGEYCFY